FGDNWNYHQLANVFDHGGKIRHTQLTREFSYEQLRKQHEGNVVPLLLINENGELSVFTRNNRPTPRPGQTVVTLVAPADVNIPSIPPPVDGVEEPDPTPPAPAGPTTPLTQN